MRGGSTFARREAEAGQKRPAADDDCRDGTVKSHLTRFGCAFRRQIP